MKSIDRLSQLLTEIEEAMSAKETMPEREYYEGLGRYVPELVRTVVQTFADLADAVTKADKEK